MMCITFWCSYTKKIFNKNNTIKRQIYYVIKLCYKFYVYLITFIITYYICFMTVFFRYYYLSNIGVSVSILF